jgi:hypothetical protein
MHSNSNRLNAVVDGVLIPDEMRDAPLVDQQAYAAKVKRGNRAFIDAVFALEDHARSLGVDLDELGL